jgi:dTDP-4-dehydrorhamnose reductase
MSVLVFGKTGQVARELQARAVVLALGRDEADLLDPSACAAAIWKEKPEAVINAAAFTAVDQAETEVDLASVINGEAPAAMARACADLGIPFVHISSDYVFDGTGEAPWRVSAPTCPLGVYGFSKLKGEEGVRAAGGRYAIVRTSWVVSAHGKNFVKTMLRLGSELDRITIVADQIGGPTAAGDVASACLSIANQLQVDPLKAGTYHFSGAPDVSWADFAREIFRQAGLSCEVVDISTSDFPTPARRPANSRLDCSATMTTFSIPRPDWRDSLTHILNDI